MKYLVFIGCLFLTSFTMAASCSNTNLGNGVTCIVSVSSHAATSAGNATTAAVNTTGATLYVAILSSYNGAPGTLSDAKGSPWSHLTAYLTTIQDEVQIYYSSAPVTGSGETFTCNGSLGSYCSLAVAVFSGTITSGNPYETGTDAGNNNSNTGGGQAVTISSVTPNGNPNVLVSGLSSYITNTATVNDGMTVYEGLPGLNNTYYGVYLALLTQSAGSAFGPTWTMSATGNYIAADLAAFQGTSGGGAATPIVPRHIIITNE